jgi:hypothetical protein
VEASGFTKDLERELETALKEQDGQEVEEVEEEFTEPEVIIVEEKKPIEVETPQQDVRENYIKVNLIPQNKINISYHQKRNKLDDTVYEKFIKVEFEVPSDEVDIQYTEDEVKQKVKKQMKKKAFRHGGEGLKKSSINKGKNKGKDDYGFTERYWE